MIAEPFFGPGIHRAAWFIEDENRRVMQKCPGESHRLALPAGEAASLLADLHIESGTVLSDYFSDTGELGRT